MSNIQNIARRLLRKLGLQRIPHEPPHLVDLRHICHHPAAIAYHNPPLPSLINAPIAKGRGLRIFPLTPQHPYVFILQQALLTHDPFSSIQRLLQRYYQHVQPHSAGDWLHLHSLPSALNHLAPNYLSMPWDTRTPEAWLQARETFAAHESQQFGHSLTLHDGWHFWGPVSDDKLLMETKRLTTILDSLQTNGLKRHDGHDGDIRAIALKDEDKWCWQIAGGEHRAAALAAMGFTHIPIRILQVVDINDIAFWPGVLNGTFSQEAAKKVFYDILNATPNPRLLNWQHEATGID